MSIPTKLEHDSFRHVVRDTPLVSIDLVVRDPDDRVLLGMRKNPPARDHWFVPGGRILKNENLDDAFARITETELGVEISRSSARILGIFEHFYTDNFTGAADFGTHYVVMAYEVKLKPNSETLPGDQHCAYERFRINDLLENSKVHDYTKAYFAAPI